MDKTKAVIRNLIDSCYGFFMKGMEEPMEFDLIYDEMIKEERILTAQITRYATGEPDIALSDVDDTVKRIKALLKSSRELALELRREAGLDG